MSEEKKNSKVETTTKEKKKNKFARRTIIVLVVLAIFAISTAISLRAQQLNIIGINEEFISVFNQRIRNQYTIFGIIFVSIYLFVYIVNKFIKKGLKQFFDEEKKKCLNYQIKVYV